MTVKERLTQFIEHLGLKPSQFEKKCGLSNGYVNNMRKSIGDDVLPKILKEYPQLNKIWLLHGEGKMLNDDIVTITRTREEESLEIIELRANVDILLEYVLKLKAEVHQKDLKKVVDEYDFDFEKQLRKLKK